MTPAPKGSLVPPAGPTLDPLASPQQVVRAVDVGRRDPFAAVVTPRLIPGVAPPKPHAVSPTGTGLKKAPMRLDVPKGFVLQGVLQGPRGQEALVEYVPAGATGAAARTGSLRVGDVGTGDESSLLPPGWRVRAIDVAQGKLVLQSGPQMVTLEL